MDLTNKNQKATGKLHNRTDQDNFELLINRLGSHNGFIRKQARIALVQSGGSAVNALIGALNNGDELTRWEAAKALSQMDKPKTAQALVHALEDDLYSVRWLAAEGLIALGQNGLKPLLRALWRTPDSIRLQNGAHHILHNLVLNNSLDSRLTTQVEPILSALDYLSPAVALQVTLIPAIKMLDLPEN